MIGRGNLVSEGYQTAPPPAAKSIPDLRERQREPTVNLQETSTKRPEEKKPKTSIRKEECMEVWARIKAPKPKLKAKAEVGKPKRRRRTHPEAV